MKALKLRNALSPKLVGIVGLAGVLYFFAIGGIAMYFMHLYQKQFERHMLESASQAPAMLSEKVALLTQGIALDSLLIRVPLSSWVVMIQEPQIANLQRK